MKRIVIIHTSLVLFDLLGGLFAEHCPGAQVYNIVDDSLLDQVSQAGKVTAGVQSRMDAYVQQALTLEPSLIFCQCSSVGEAFAQACKRADGPGIAVPSLQIDAPMAQKAAALCPDGGKIAVVATVSSTIGPSTRLAERMAQKRGKSVTVTPFLIDGALDILMKEKDRPKHDRLVLSRVEEACAANDVVMLAQGSMYQISLQMQNLSKPVLASPLLGVLAAKEILEK